MWVNDKLVWIIVDEKGEIINKKKSSVEHFRNVGVLKLVSYFF